MAFYENKYFIILSAILLLWIYIVWSYNEMSKFMDNEYAPSKEKIALFNGIWKYYD